MSISPSPTLRFDPMTGLLPAIIQDADTGQVLMLGYLNEEAWVQTQASGRVTFFSRSRNQLWVKGETSGHFLTVVSLHPDCDADSVLIRARPSGPSCHRGTTSCFEQSGQVVPPAAPVGFLGQLERVIQQRRDYPEQSSGSYTVSLFALGIPKIAQKVGEEAVETVIDAVAGHREALPGEVADLLFHLLVLLVASGLPLAEVMAELEQRHKK
jgi:phosphoribosyl-ATP pyrophosphohydrolase/phosphoribosyl-AMP cyclohydrolase